MAPARLLPAELWLWSCLLKRLLSVCLLSMRCHLKTDHSDFPTLLFPRANTNKRGGEGILSQAVERKPGSCAQLHVSLLFRACQMSNGKRKSTGWNFRGSQGGAHGFSVDNGGIWVVQLLQNTMMLESRLLFWDVALWPGLH